MISIIACRENQKSSQVLAEIIQENGDSVVYVQENEFGGIFQRGKFVNSKKDSTWTLYKNGIVTGHDNWFKGKLFGEQKRIASSSVNYTFYSIDSKPLFFYELRNCMVKSIEGEPIFIIENKSKLGINEYYENVCLIPPSNDCIEISVIAELHSESHLIKELFNSNNTSFDYYGSAFCKQKIRVSELTIGRYYIKYYTYVKNDATIIKSDTFVVNYEVR